VGPEGERGLRVVGVEGSGSVMGGVGKAGCSLYWLARKGRGSRLLTVSNEILLTES